MNNLNILVGCEESQVITSKMFEKGHHAFSCDLQETSGPYPARHLQMDIFTAFKLLKWDLIILHPPCTYLTVSGNRWYGKSGKFFLRREAVDWTQRLWDTAISICNHVAMENPVGVLNTMGDFPKPQYIQPWQFGHGETKKTGLWLHNLPELEPTNIVSGRDTRIWKMPPSEDRQKLRSKTYDGIGEAITDQWCDFVLKAKYNEQTKTSHTTSNASSL